MKENAIVSCFLNSKKMTPSRRKLKATGEMPTLQKLYTNNYNEKDLSIILVEW